MKARAEAGLKRRAATCERREDGQEQDKTKQETANAERRARSAFFYRRKRRFQRMLANERRFFFELRGAPGDRRQRRFHLAFEKLGGLVARQTLEKNAPRRRKLDRRRRVDAEFVANFLAVRVVDVDLNADEFAREAGDLFVPKRAFEHRLAVRAVLRHKEEKNRFVFGLRAPHRFVEIDDELDPIAFELPFVRDVGDERIGGRFRFSPTRKSDDGGDRGERRAPSRDRFYKLVPHFKLQFFQSVETSSAGLAGANGREDRESVESVDADSS